MSSASTIDPRFSGAEFFESQRHPRVGAFFRVSLEEF
jgi:hypothetical protein